MIIEVGKTYRAMFGIYDSDLSDLKVLKIRRRGNECVVDLRVYSPGLPWPLRQLFGMYSGGHKLAWLIGQIEQVEISREADRQAQDGWHEIDSIDAKYVGDQSK